MNNFLVIGVNPANNEKSVPTDSLITITFAKHMDKNTLSESTLILKEANGDTVSYSIQYLESTMQAILRPTDGLKPGTVYQLEVVGSPTGIRSIVGDYMGYSRSFTFTTAFGVALSPPANVEASVQNGYVTVTWDRPIDYDISKQLTYEVVISTSNDIEQPAIWPGVGDINQTGATLLNIPKKFEDGNYYAHVRAIDGESESDWALTQFLVETKTEPIPIPDPGSGNGGGGDIFSFDILDTYPRRDDVDITPEKIVIAFSSTVDESTVTNDSIYVLKKADKKNLSFIDFMTEYAPNKQVPARIEVNGTVVTLEADLEDDAEYTVIVRESVKNTDGNTLGIAYHWSFMSKFTYLYGDAELIRNDVGVFITGVSNKILYKMMRDNSVHAYNIVSQTDSFQQGDYEGGAAPYYVHQYVRYKTAYDLLITGYMQSSSGSGSAVTLGDLTVDKKSSQNDITSLIREVKDMIKPWEDAIHGHHNRGYAKPVSVVKGENTDYPEFLTRSEFRELGQ